MMLIPAAQVGELEFANPEWFGVLWLVPMLGAIMLVGSMIRLLMLRKFADRALFRQLGGGAFIARRALKATLVLSALALLVIAMARPQFRKGERNVERRGRDVVFVIDVSRSMLARDLAPNRLERVKLWVNDALTAMEGDRVGLVAFAGAAVVKSPLTLDYAFFRFAVDELSANDLLSPGELVETMEFRRIQSVSQGGSMIGDAIRKASNEVFDRTEGRFRDIILITDGEDQGSFPVEAAAQAGELGIRIIAIGVGDDGDGATIPLMAEQGGRSVADDAGVPLTYAGRAVRTRLDRTAMTRIARASSDGVYIHVATGTNFNLDRVYRDLVASASQSVYEDESVVEYDERYHLFLVPAVIILLLEGFIGAARRR